MSFEQNRSAADAIACEAVLWATAAIERINGKGSAAHQPEQIAAFAAVYVQSYQTGIIEALKEIHGAT